MSDMKVTMIREDLKNIPDYSLPEGFHFRSFKEGDEETWTKIETAAGEFDSEEKAMERFEREFGPHIDKFKDRCFFVENKEGKLVATTTAWYGFFEEDNEKIGRIHWVSVIPEYQGKKLAKPLLSKAMNVLTKYHEKVYLTSQTSSTKAINMYLDYGFKPVVNKPYDKDAWKILEEELDKELI